MRLAQASEIAKPGAASPGTRPPNTYEVSSCQETNDPYERFFSFFSAYRAGAVYSQSRVLT
jgi:hypothetical protein